MKGKFFSNTLYSCSPFRFDSIWTKPAFTGLKYTNWDHGSGLRRRGGANVVNGTIGALFR